MTKTEAATYLYDASLERNGGKDIKTIRPDVIKRMDEGDSQTIRAVCSAESRSQPPVGEQQGHNVPRIASGHYLVASLTHERADR
jgi:hypothetical protein